MIDMRAHDVLKVLGPRVRLDKVPDNQAIGAFLFWHLEGQVVEFIWQSLILISRSEFAESHHCHEHHGLLACELSARANVGREDISQCLARPRNFPVVLTVVHRQACLIKLWIKRVRCIKQPCQSRTASFVYFYLWSEEFSVNPLWKTVVAPFCVGPKSFTTRQCVQKQLASSCLICCPHQCFFCFDREANKISAARGVNV